jgi:hypothetical protein
MAIVEMVIKIRGLYSDCWSENKPNATPELRIWVKLKIPSITASEAWRGICSTTINLVY